MRQGRGKNPDELVLRINLKLAKEPGETEAKNRGAEDILGQLLHWAAHATTGISTGAEGGYHSREFGEIADRLGLEIKYRDGVGGAPVAVAVNGHNPDMLIPQGLKQFRAEIKALDKAMRDWEPETEDAARERARGPLAMVCSCSPPADNESQLWRGPRRRHHLLSVRQALQDRSGPAIQRGRPHLS